MTNLVRESVRAKPDRVGTPHAHAPDRVWPGTGVRVEGLFCPSNYGVMGRTSPPQADFPREVENDVHVLSLLQEACGGASEAVRRERRLRMTDNTPSIRTRPVMADQKGA